jgi:hypothetical protein
LLLIFKELRFALPWGSPAAGGGFVGWETTAENCRPLATALALVLILCWNYGAVKNVENNFTFCRASTCNFNLLQTTEFF